MHPRRVLDLGTGTGVLAIAAAKASHGAVLASDIDPAVGARSPATTPVSTQPDIGCR